MSDKKIFFLEFVSFFVQRNAEEKIANFFP